MIFFVSPENDSFEIREFLQVQGSPFTNHILPITYEQIVARRELPLGSYIFSAIDQLSPAQREITALCWRELSKASPQITLLNHPHQVLCRYELLDTLFQMKRNAFRVFRASNFAASAKFPVFLRTEREHLGSLSGLLYSKRALLRSLAKALAEGYRLSDLIIVEFCDTADPAGVFVKYSAYIVGGAIVPNHIVHSKIWVTKWAGRIADPALVQEEIDYVGNNPHAGWLRETFAIAKIGYGRIDYAFKDSVPQVWEINTNPTVWRLADADPVRAAARKVRAPVRDRFLKLFDAAFAAIDPALDPAQTIPIHISATQLRRLHAEQAAGARAAKTRAAVSRATHSFFELLHRLRFKS